MIRNFIHKGLSKFYFTGSLSGIQPSHARKLSLILARLGAIVSPEDMNLPRFDFHGLKGDREGSYSVGVNKNWRLVFKFDGKDPFDVDYLDYH